MKKNEIIRIFLIIGNVLLAFVTLFSVFYTVFWKEIYCTVDAEWKPIIYIYPKKDMNVTITVTHPENFSVTYPKYQDGWSVLAKKDGTLIDSTGRSYYALYWEGKNANFSMKNEGFIVKGKDVAKFLEEKLKILGLNEREANEFIIYWLPKLEKNPYNYIRFQTMEEINEYMGLNIDPKPDTLIRIVMEYKALSKQITISEQKLVSPIRNGYTIVEWGGTQVH